MQTLFLIKTFGKTLMSSKKNNSDINVAYWFYRKAEKQNIKLSEAKIQHLLFLTQMHYSMKHEELLMPSLFVYSKSEIYDPAVRTIMDYGFPLMPTPEFDADVSDFLELIWQKYASLSQEQLQEFIYSLKYFQNLTPQKDDIIINPLNLIDSFSSSIRYKKSETKSKIMISQNGPVKVSKWTPRKLKK